MTEYNLPNYNDVAISQSTTVNTTL